MSDKEVDTMAEAAELVGLGDRPNGDEAPEQAPEEATGPGPEEDNPSKKTWYKQSFCESWMTDPVLCDWLRKDDADDPSFAACEFCDCKFKNPNKRTLLKHSQTEKHQKSARKRPPDTTDSLVAAPGQIIGSRRKRHYVQITRIQSFSSAHRLHSSHLSDEVNKAVYGKCNNPYGHGHNYKAEIELRGPVKAQTGMICNVSDLKSWINDAIMEPLDHKHLDLEVDWFKANPSTMENIAIFIWLHMKAIMTDPDLLHSVKIWETENQFAIYKGERL